MAGFVDFFRLVWRWLSSPSGVVVPPPIIDDAVNFAYTQDDAANFAYTQDDTVNFWS